MRSLLLALLFVAAMLHAATSVAQDELPAVLRTAADDPRKGPRLVYERDAPRCPDEKTFRREVAYWVDGRDHLADDSPDVVRVRLGWTAGRYFGVVTYTDASGRTKRKLVTRDGDWCPMLARWAALEVSEHIPDRPPPEPCPTCPECLACQACKAGPACPPAQRAPSCPQQPRPWYMDVTIGIRAYGLMSAFLTPNVAPGLAIGGDVQGEIFSLAAEIRVVLPSTVLATEQIPGTTSFYPREFDLSQFSALLVPCARWKYLVGCAVAQGGYFLYRSPVQEDTWATWGLGPRLGFEVPFADRFAVFGFGEVLFNPAPGTVLIDRPPPDHPDGPIANVQWKQPVASAFFGAGLSVKFK